MGLTLKSDLNHTSDLTRRVFSSDSDLTFDLERTHLSLFSWGGELVFNKDSDKLGTWDLVPKTWTQTQILANIPGVTLYCDIVLCNIGVYF